MNTGILLLGGKGIRLTPQSNFVNKHLNLLYDKPLFFYPLTTLILSGIDRLILCCNQKEKKVFLDYSNYLKKLGLPTFINVQPLGEGIPSAIYTCQKLIPKNSKIKIMLGDNLLVGNNLVNILHFDNNDYSTIFIKKTRNMNNFGIVRTLNNDYKFIEKPKNIYLNDKAVLGIYFFQYEMLKLIKELKKSKRGETEIVDLLNLLKNKKSIIRKELGRGIYWSDIGNNDSFIESANFLKNLQYNSNEFIGLPEEALYRKNKLNTKSLKYVKDFYKGNLNITEYLKNLFL